MVKERGQKPPYSIKIEMLLSWRWEELHPKLGLPCICKVNEKKMCLYQLKLRNQHYMVTEKNGGNVPIPKDKRHLYINVDCGWCEECRKKIANEWRVRLTEEIRYTAGAEFVTFSFSPEKIRQLENEMIKKKWKGLYNNEEKETDVNQLAAYAVRMWSERWRKKTQKAPFHWLITELGHKGSERIHLHGIIFNKACEERTKFRQKILNTWQYGNIYIGSYVNAKTMNYITKYVQKLDAHHKGYKQKIFASQKIGIAYLETAAAKAHIFTYEKTMTYYRAPNGIKLGLPRYYKYKLWNEEEREWLWSYTLDQQKINIQGVEHDLTKESAESFQKALKGARESNKLTGYGDNTTTVKKYVITDLMKMSYIEMIDYDRKKLVKHRERRLTEKILTYAEMCEQRKRLNKYLIEEGKDKSWNIDMTVWGEYIGNLTDNERKHNKELAMAKREGLCLRAWRLKKKGLPYW